MGYGAVKYADLKNQRLTNYKFNFDQMLNLTGNTAVYLLYAHARIAGIIRKSSKDINGGDHRELPCTLVQKENTASYATVQTWHTSRCCMSHMVPRCKHQQLTVHDTL
jgi:arginyl-tRNA synthetase